MNDQCETCGVGYYLPSGVCDHCNLSRVWSYPRFGLIFETVHNFGEPGSVKFRFFSGRVHGPVCPTRKEAFWRWFLNRFFNR